MQEEITRSEYQRRFRAMTPEQRLAEMSRIGVTEVLRLMATAQEANVNTVVSTDTKFLGGSQPTALGGA